jgi:hypothetical protein
VCHIGQDQLGPSTFVHCRIENQQQLLGNIGDRHSEGEEARRGKDSFSQKDLSGLLNAGEMLFTVDTINKTIEGAKQSGELC